MVPALLRAKERESGQVIGTDSLLVCQGRVRFHDYAPQIGFGKGKKMIFCGIWFFGQDSEIDYAFIQLFRDLLCIAACNMVTHTRKCIFKLPDGGGKMPDLVRFRHTEVNIAPESIVQGKKFRCDLIGYF